MAARKKILADCVAVSSLLRKDRYNVPGHQRYYDWSSDMVEQFLLDLDLAIKDRQPEYFLGTIMLIRASKADAPVWEINDGQQRLMTYSLVCAALVRQFRRQANGDWEKRRDLLKMLLRLDWRTNAGLDEFFSVRETELALRPPRNDFICYKSLVGGRNWEDDSNLSRAWGTIGRFLESPERRPASWLNSFYRYLVRNVSVVRLVVPPHLDKHAIFETLNARGKQLDDIDLLKNNFLSLCGSESAKERVTDAFERMHIIFRTNKRHAEYARCFLQCNYGYIQEGKLYHKTKSLIASSGRHRKSVTALLERMSSTPCQTFLAIRSPSSRPEYFGHLGRLAGTVNRNRGVEHFFGELSEYTVAHPVLLALLLRYEKSQTPRAARLAAACANILCSFIMRLVYTRASFQPSRYERDLAELAFGITKGDCKTAAKFLVAIKEIDAKSSGINITDDTEFRQALFDLSVGSVRKAQSFLGAVMEYENPRVDVDLPQMSAVQVFHESDEKGESWNFPKETCAHYQRRLGNWVLLNDKDIGEHERASGFPDKCALYAKSPFVRVRKLSSLGNWDPGSIENQQRGLARTAAQVWGFAT